MFKAIQTSVSGLLAATTRLNTAADNIVNAQNTSRIFPDGEPGNESTYIPKKTVPTSLATGGIMTRTIPVSPATLPIFSPDSPLANAKGLVGSPNISLPAEIAELTRASQAYKANAKTLKSLDETFQALLKI